MVHCHCCARVDPDHPDRRTYLGWLYLSSNRGDLLCYLLTVSVWRDRRRRRKADNSDDAADRSSEPTHIFFPDESVRRCARTCEVRPRQARPATGALKVRLQWPLASRGRPACTRNIDGAVWPGNRCRRRNHTDNCKVKDRPCRPKRFSPCCS